MPFATKSTIDGNQTIEGFRSSTILSPDINRAIPQFFVPSWDRVEPTIARVLGLSDQERQSQMAQVDSLFSGRHYNFKQVLERHFDRINEYLETFNLDHVLDGIDVQTRLLIGAYFTKEYTVGAAAICNPSMVPHPDQSGLGMGETRIILSLRAVGEGHISSLQFCSGILSKSNRLTLDPMSPVARIPNIIKNPLFSKQNFRLNLEGLVPDGRVADLVLRHLPDPFSFTELQQTMRQVSMNHLKSDFFNPDVLKSMDWVSRSNYEIEFEPESELSERVIFPSSENDRNGIEDVRFVKFSYDDIKVVYYATYTAYNGVTILPQLIETRDFVNFRFRTINGPVARNKGMALFPRKIRGKYAMLSRQDGIGLYVMYSDSLTYWETATKIKEPRFPWEFVQVGNCSSPIETEKGWIVIVHGVGPMRRYCLGAMLLDLNDPTKVIAELKDPMMQPSDEERNGYVPNVLYSCGGMRRHGDIVLPYAYSDLAIRYAAINIESLLAQLLQNLTS